MAPLMHRIPSFGLQPPVVWGVVFVAAVSAALTLVLVLPVIGPSRQLATGDIAPRTYKAPRDIPAYQSQYLTDEHRQQAAAAVPNVLNFDPQVREEQAARVRDVIQHISALRESDRLTVD